MASTIGKVVAHVQANTSNFKKGIQSSSKRLRAFGKGVAQAGIAVAKFAAAVAAAGTALVAALVNRAAKAIDATAKLADNLGLAIENLQAYELGAKLAGVSQTELATGLRRFAKNVSDANRGLSTATEAFDALGISAEELEKKTPEEALGMVADALSTMNNVYDRARVAQDLFGRSGVNLVKFLENGSRGLEQMSAEAERLGITVSRVDASKVEQMNDQITKLKARFFGLTQTLAVQLAPTVVSIVNTFLKWSDEIKGVEDAIATMVEHSVKKLGELKDMTSQVQTLWTKAQKTTTDVLTGAMAKAVMEFNKLLDLGEEAGIDVEKWRQGGKDIIAALELTQDEYDSLIKKMEAEPLPSAKLLQEWLKNVKAVSDEAEKWEGFKPEPLVIPDLDEVFDGMDELSGSASNLVRELKAQEVRSGASISAQARIARSTDPQKQIVKNTGQQVKAQEKATQVLEKINQSLNSNLANQIVLLG